MSVDLSQFNSLFEIGFAVHIAVAFLERIYAGQLPVRMERIGERLKAMERFKRALQEAKAKREATGEAYVLQLPHAVIDNAVWAERNESAVERLYSLSHALQSRLTSLKRILTLITITSIMVVLYSITLLFLIGLDLALVKDINALTASLLVLAQLLPLPLAALVFYIIARRMSQEIDRKLRGVGELRVVVTSPSSQSPAAYTSVEEIYQRDLGRSIHLA